MMPSCFRPLSIARRTCALLRDRRGATAVEYALILAMIVLTMVGTLSILADATTSMWTMVGTKIEAAR